MGDYREVIAVWSFSSEEFASLQDPLDPETSLFIHQFNAFYLHICKDSSEKEYFGGGAGYRIEDSRRPKVGDSYFSHLLSPIVGSLWTKIIRDLYSQSLRLPNEGYLPWYRQKEISTNRFRRILL